jgi:hypothetical protein
MRARGSHGQRVAVGVCTRSELGAQRAAGAAAVIDDHLLPQPLRKALTHQARNDVGRAARWKRDDQADRLRRIAGLCKRCAYGRSEQDRGKGADRNMR